MLPLHDSESEVVVHWTCHNALGSPYWSYGYDWFVTYDSCDMEFDTVECKEEWEEGICVETCPRCGASLSQ